MNPHQILACVELAIYCALLVPITFCTYHYVLRKQTAWLYLYAFAIAKFTGPAIFLALSNQNPPSIGLEIAAQILYQIALGPLLSATLSFVNTSSKSTERKDHNPLAQTTKGAPLSGLLRLVHPIIITGLVLGVVGGVDRSPSSSGTPDKDTYERGERLSKASSALFLVALAGIAIGAARLWKSRRDLKTVSYYINTCMVVALPVLLLRVIYSILAAANLQSPENATRASKFDLLRGDWVIYFFLGFLAQLVVFAVYVGCGVFAWVRERRASNY
ncbi:hypothetical protein BDW62DRAFT_200093 [Aspergillus aurantiobrunneus]